VKNRFGLVALALFLAMPLFAQRREDQDPALRLDRNVALQIRELNAEKESRTKTQQKIDSQLLYALKAHRGQRLTPHVQSFDLVGADDMDGQTIVDISAVISDSLLDQLRSSGAYIINAFPEYHAARAIVSLDRLEAIASIPGVIFIQPKQEAITNGPRSPEDPGASDMPNATTGVSRLRQQLAEALNARFGIHDQSVGAAASQGDVTHGANVARASYGVTGAGVKIGVLSDGVTSLAASQALGDLGPVTVLPGQAGSGDEGTAMLEIVHDLAPGAQLYFATAFTSITSFASNIKALRTAGCDIIIDDVFYFAESAFQDGQAPSVISPTNAGVVIQAVNDVTSSGAMYFSSAGNSGNKNDGTSGVWEGDFVDGGSLAIIPGGTVHNFGGAAVSDQMTNTTTFTLKWNDPLGGSNNDYDIYILNSTGTAVVAALTNVQNGTQDPFEGASFSAAQTGLRFVVFKKTGSQPRYFQLNTNRGRLAINTDGQTHGHAAAANAFGCAATPAANFAAPPNPAGPFPGQFNSSNTVELFSSDGPRHLFYDPAGAQFTPGNLTSTGGIVRQKPDITAADGVSDTGVGGFGSPFFGTSAAAPHAGAIAGLLKSAGSFTNAQIRTALTSTAIDIEGPGVDRDSGAGIIMPTPAAAALGVTGVATPEIASFTAAEAPGDSNGSIDPGEGATLTVQLKNNGLVTAGSVVAVLSSATPGITIASPTSASFGSLAPAASSSGTYRFMVASNASCPMLVDFDLTVTYTGGPSPKVYSMRIHTGLAANIFSATLNTSPPPASPFYTGATGTQTGRINRFAPPSVCGTQKAYPGLQTATGTRRFQTFSFQTCNNPVPACVTINLSNPAVNLFAVAYLGSYNPANLAQNYLGDSGTSGNGLQANFNVTLPPGVQTLVVVVHEVNPGAGTGSNYSLTVDGCISAAGSCPVRNLPPLALAHNVTVSAGASCNASASIDNGSSDPEGGQLTLSQSPAGPYGLGSTPVTLTVTDNKGAFAQASANVTVVDTTRPAINCPADITVNAAAGTCSAGVSVGTPTATDNCSTPSVSGARSDGQPLSGLYPVGITTITWTATDAAGNSGTCTQRVTVKDAQPPTINVPAPITTEFTSESGAVVTFTVTSSDNCSSVTQSCAPASGSTFAIGTTTVNCVATDLAGNSTPASFTVTVLGALGTKLDAISDIQAFLATVTDRQDSDAIGRALTSLKKSVDPALWTDQTHPKDGSVFQNEKDAVNQLTNVIHHRGSDATLQSFVDRIVKSDRLLCTVAISDAAAAGASNTTGYAQAVSLRDSGDQMVANAQYESSIEQYRNSWSKAVGSH